MPALVSNSKIWGEMFGTSEMHYLFSDEKTIQLYLDVEAALARSQSKLGIIPSEAGQKISEVAKIDIIDWEKLQKRTSIVGYPILPVVEQLSDNVSDGYGVWVESGGSLYGI